MLLQLTVTYSNNENRRRLSIGVGCADRVERNVQKEKEELPQGLVGAVQTSYTAATRSRSSLSPGVGRSAADALQRC